MAWMTSPEVTAGANPARRLIRDLVADDCPCYSPPDLKSETCLCLRSAIAFLRLDLGTTEQLSEPCPSPQARPQLISVGFAELQVIAYSVPTSTLAKVQT